MMRSSVTSGRYSEPAADLIMRWCSVNGPNCHSENSLVWVKSSIELERQSLVSSGLSWASCW